jgi:hypothetical protein
MQQAVSNLQSIAKKLTDELEQSTIEKAASLLDSLSHPLSAEDIAALMTLLPESGDTAFGLNWTILHAIEASPCWPMWDLLEENGSEWVEIFLIRLRNAGISKC